MCACVSRGHRSWLALALLHRKYHHALQLLDSHLLPYLAHSPYSLPQVKSYYDLPASDDEQQEEDETPAGRQLAGEQGVPGEGPQQPIMAESEPSPGSGDQLAACTTATAAADGDSPGASCTAAHDKATCHASGAVAGGTPVEHDRMMNACETGGAAAAVSGESL